MQTVIVLSCLADLCLNITKIPWAQAGSMGISTMERFEPPWLSSGATWAFGDNLAQIGGYTHRLCKTHPVIVWDTYLCILGVEGKLSRIG